MRTIIGVCLDESSSMGNGGKREAAVSAFNEYLKTQQDAKLDECLMSVVKFNTKAWVLDKVAPIAELKPLDDTRYRPMGNTALNDAIIYVVKEIESGMQADDRALIVILTDGEENASEASKADVLKLIEEFTAKGNYTFVYLSAAPTAFHDAKGYGIPMANAGQYSNTSRGVASTMRSLNANSVAYRSSSAPQATGMSAGVGLDDDDPQPNPAPNSAVRPGPVPRAMTPQVPTADRNMWPKK